MRANTPSEVVRIVGSLVRLADSGLARSAARNAATSMHAERSRQIEDARTMRDLQKIPARRPTAARTPQRRAAH